MAPPAGRLPWAPPQERLGWPERPLGQLGAWRWAGRTGSPPHQHLPVPETSTWLPFLLSLLPLPRLGLPSRTRGPATRAADREPRGPGGPTLSCELVEGGRGFSPRLDHRRAQRASAGWGQARAARLSGPPLLGSAAMWTAGKPDPEGLLLGGEQAGRQQLPLSQRCGGESLCSGHSPSTLTVPEGDCVHPASGRGLALSSQPPHGSLALKPPPTVQPIGPTQGPTKRWRGPPSSLPLPQAGRDGPPGRLVSPAGCSRRTRAERCRAGSQAWASLPGCTGRRLLCSQHTVS